MARPRRLRNLEERFDWYADALENEPFFAVGAWAARHMPDARAVKLDLGCGKGSFVLRNAVAEPDVLWIGLDRDKNCIAMCAKYALEKGIANAVFAVAEGNDVGQIFAPGELDHIQLNFCTPFPASRYAYRRLTHVDSLLGYRSALAADATVEFRTDSNPLWQWSRSQFELAGYALDLVNDDFRAFAPGAIGSEYEDRLCSEGANVHIIRAHPEGATPDAASVVQTVPMGLASYLPDDLDSLTYIPYGMEDTVFNLKRKAIKAAEREARHAAREAARAADRVTGEPGE